MKLLKQLLGFSIVALSVMGVCSTAYAADLKIGVVDGQVILQKSPVAKALNDQLQAKFGARQEKLVAEKKSIQAEVQDFTKNQAVMKAEDQVKLKNKILADQQAYNTEFESLRDDYRQEQAKDLQSFNDKLQAAVAKVAKKDQYNLVLFRAAVPYMETTADVTQEVMDAMNQ